MRKKKVKLIYLEWSDAVTFNEGWSDKNNIVDWAKNEDWIIKQAGFLIQENHNYLLLASKYNPQDITEDKYSEITKIPKTWIKRRKSISFF